MATLRISETDIIRTRAAGPEPCNTLVFLRCLALGIDLQTHGNNFRGDAKFSTEFRLDSYIQGQYEWYKENTLVSATASMRFLNTTTDLTFMMAVDHVYPELQQIDGSLAFTFGYAGRMEDDAWFSGGVMVLEVTITAYVLCFEPVTEVQSSGTQRTPWAKVVNEGPKLSELLGKSTKRRRDAAVPESQGKPRGIYGH